jgi:hypothetical protein
MSSDENRLNDVRVREGEGEPDNMNAIAEAMIAVLAAMRGVGATAYETDVFSRAMLLNMALAEGQAV